MMGLLTTGALFYCLALVPLTYAGLAKTGVAVTFFATLATVAMLIAVAVIYRFVLGEKMLRFLAKLLRGHDPEVVHPEHAFRVWHTDETLHCQYRDELAVSIRWDDLHEIRITTTDEGPMVPDVFWRFSSGDREIVFPQMALGEKPVIDHAMKLPGYDYEQSIAAMRGTENAEFIVWRRS